MGRVNLIDLYGRAPLVPTTIGTHDVGQLRGRALRTDAAGRTAQAPVRRTATTRLCFAGLALGNGHQSSLSTKRVDPSHFFGFIGTNVDETEFVKCSPARVYRSLTVATLVISVHPTVRTETLAVLATQRRQRQIEEYGVVDQGGQIDKIVLDEVGLVIAGCAGIDQMLVDRDVADAEDGRRAPPTDTVPRRFDPAARA